MRVSRRGWVILASVLSFSTALGPAAEAATRGNLLSDLGKFLRYRPVHVVTNLAQNERWASLLSEMGSEGYNTVRLQDANYSRVDVAKRSYLFLVDREAGSFPARLNFMLPDAARSVCNDPGSDTAIMAPAASGNGTLVFVSAPNAATLYRFINDDIRSDTMSVGQYVRSGSAKMSVSDPVPSAPRIVWPTGTVHATRPCVFLSHHALRSQTRLCFDLQVAPEGALREIEWADAVPRTVQTGEASDPTGWEALSQSLRPAQSYDLALWGVRPTTDSGQDRTVLYAYEPMFDLKPGQAYELRARAVVLRADGTRMTGEWSSVAGKCAFAVQAQAERELEQAWRITSTPSFSERDATFAPAGVFGDDRDHLMFAADQSAPGVYQIWQTAVKLKSSQGPTQVSELKRVTVASRGSSDSGPCWGPTGTDGTTSVTFTRTGEAGGTDASARIWCTPVATPGHDVNLGAYTRLTNYDEKTYDPAWSPDGMTLAYVVDSQRGVPEIWLVTPGEAPRVVTTGKRPAWSKDGRRLYYASDANGSWDIWYRDLATGETTVVVGRADAQEVDFAINPVTGDIAYVSSEVGNFDIWLYKAADGTTDQLTKWYGQDEEPAWDPAGTVIVYSTTRFSPNTGQYDLAYLDISKRTSPTLVEPGAAPTPQ